MGQDCEQARIHWTENEFNVVSLPSAKRYNKMPETRSIMAFFSLKLEHLIDLD